MAKFYKAKIKHLTRPTKESVSIVFDIPMKDKEAFTYLPGQHITVRTMIDGEDTRRSYSICSCPINEELSIAIKKVEGGLFSTYACEKLQQGEELELMAPTGHFHPDLNQSNKKLYVGFASGSGITPIISIIKTVLASEPKSRFILFYGNQRTGSIIFREELEGLKNECLERFSLHHILSRERQESDLFNGRIEKEKIRKYAKIYFDIDEVDEVFICGPEQMILSTEETLLDLGMNKEKIHTELFTSPVGKLGGENKEIKHEKTSAEVTIIQDGNKFSFPYDSDKSILDAAFDKGADLPYACKGGVCSTCVAKLENGEVDMDVNYALEPDELERGLVLTCQSFPKSEKVVLNFDV